MHPYRLSLLQTGLFWEERDRNLDMFEAMIQGLDRGVDAVLLPEMFQTGFTMDAERHAETMDGPTAEWMRKISSRYGKAIGGSIIISEGDVYYNRFIWAVPDGTLSTYDKRHLFFLERDSGNYTAGMRRVVVEDKGWRILLAVCYDLRFPVWLRNREDYEAIFLVANWPAPRRDVWHKLLMARAIENQCYVAAVNRIGSDGNGIDYSGDSMVVDPKGNIVVQAEQEAEAILDATLDFDELMRFKTKFPAWQDRDEFDLKL